MSQAVPFFRGTAFLYPKRGDSVKLSPEFTSDLSSPSVYATADVYILDNPFSIDRSYAYYIPADMTDEVTKDHS